MRRDDATTMTTRRQTMTTKRRDDNDAPSTLSSPSPTSRDDATTTARRVQRHDNDGAPLPLPSPTSCDNATTTACCPLPFAHKREHECYVSVCVRICRRMDATLLPSPPSHLPHATTRRRRRPTLPLVFCSPSPCDKHESPPIPMAIPARAAGTCVGNNGYGYRYGSQNCGPHGLLERANPNS